MLHRSPVLSVTLKQVSRLRAPYFPPFYTDLHCNGNLEFCRRGGNTVPYFVPLPDRNISESTQRFQWVIPEDSVTFQWAERAPRQRPGRGQGNAGRQRRRWMVFDHVGRRKKHGKKAGRSVTQKAQRRESQFVAVRRGKILRRSEGVREHSAQWKSSSSYRVPIKDHWPGRSVTNYPSSSTYDSISMADSFLMSNRSARISAKSPPDDFINTQPTPLWVDARGGLEINSDRGTCCLKSTFAPTIHFIPLSLLSKRWSHKVHNGTLFHKSDGAFTCKNLFPSALWLVPRRHTHWHTVAAARFESEPLLAFHYITSRLNGYWMPPHQAESHLQLQGRYTPITHERQARGYLICRWSQVDGFTLQSQQTWRSSEPWVVNI